jgi:hypothetical protein
MLIEGLRVENWIMNTDTSDVAKPEYLRIEE